MIAGVRHPALSLIRSIPLIAALAFGLAGPVQADEAPSANVSPTGPAAAAASVPHRKLGAELVIRALSMLGVDYKWGGDTPDTGMDCSGLVRYVYDGLMDRMLPRRAEEMSREGKPVDRHSLQPGDLVFFNTLRRAFSHVGIYIGNNQFVHAPSTGKQVQIESLQSGYWTKRFNGARRMFDDPPPTSLN